MPVHASLQGHFIENRARLMEGFVQTASGNNILLSCLVPENEQEAAQIAEARRIVQDFTEWAKES